jgi:UrcA family protein
MLKVTHRSQSLQIATLSIALMCGAAAFAVQAAAPGGETTGVKVTYGDLNLASEQGNQALLARIRAAARRACFADEVDSRDLQAAGNAGRCESAAIKQAVLSVCGRQQSTDGYSSCPRNPGARRDAMALGH